MTHPSLSAPITHAANDNAVLQAQGLSQHPELLSNLVGQLPVDEKDQLGQCVVGFYSVYPITFGTGNKSCFGACLPKSGRTGLCTLLLMSFLGQWL